MKTIFRSIAIALTALLYSISVLNIAFADGIIAQGGGLGRYDSQPGTTAGGGGLGGNSSQPGTIAGGGGLGRNTAPGTTAGGGIGSSVPSSDFVASIVGQNARWEDLNESRLRDLMDRMQHSATMLAPRDFIGGVQTVIVRVTAFPDAVSGSFKQDVFRWWSNTYGQMLRGRSPRLNVDECQSAIQRGDLNQADNACGTASFDFSLLPAGNDEELSRLGVRLASARGLTGASVGNTPWFNLSTSEVGRLTSWLDENWRREGSQNAARVVLNIVLRRTFEGANREGSMNQGRLDLWSSSEREQIGNWWVQFAERQLNQRSSLDSRQCLGAFRNLSPWERAAESCAFEAAGLR